MVGQALTYAGVAVSLVAIFALDNPQLAWPGRHVWSTQLALPALAATGGVVVNIASTAGLDHAPYDWPEYAAAKAGLIRFTTAMADPPRRWANVRVTCVVPDWVHTTRAEAELAAMTVDERAAHPTPIPLPVLTDAVIELVRNDDLSGHVVVLRPDQRRVR
jgi:NAD(P)-dependent dehydrogenase (short-subunit alcohol dehydrogenase family)